MNRKITAALVALPLALGLSACNYDDKAGEAIASRSSANADANKTTAKASDSLEQSNLRRRLAIEGRGDQVGYVYLISFAKPLGYYVVKGKVSSSGSQLAPEQDVIRDPGQLGGGNVVVDGPQDDGTYGNGDPGIFFFTADGVFVHTSLDYVYSTDPLPLDVPELGK